VGFTWLATLAVRMERVAVESVDPTNAGGVERRRLDDRLDAGELAVNHYRIDAGERVAGLHAHAD